MHATITTTTNPTTWPDALAAVAGANQHAAQVGGSHAPGSPEEGQFNDAAAAIGDAINRLVTTPAPDFAAVSRKLDLLAEEFGGGDSEQLAAIREDLARLAGVDCEPDLSTITKEEGGN